MQHRIQRFRIFHNVVFKDISPFTTQPFHLPSKRVTLLTLLASQIQRLFWALVADSKGSAVSSDDKICSKLPRCADHTYLDICFQLHAKIILRCLSADSNVKMLSLTWKKLFFKFPYAPITSIKIFLQGNVLSLITHHPEVIFIVFCSVTQ